MTNKEMLNNLKAYIIGLGFGDETLKQTCARIGTGNLGAAQGAVLKSYGTYEIVRTNNNSSALSFSTSAALGLKKQASSLNKNAVIPPNSVLLGGCCILPPKAFLCRSITWLYS